VFDKILLGKSSDILKEIDMSKITYLF